MKKEYLKLNCDEVRFQAKLSKEESKAVDDLCEEQNITKRQFIKIGYSLIKECISTNIITFDELKDVAVKLDNTVDSDINKVMAIFYEINPTINFGNKNQRKAVEFLVKQMGLERTINTVKYSNSQQGKKFCPIITTPIQLKDKLAQLKIYYDRSKEDSKKVGCIKL